MKLDTRTMNMLGLLAIVVVLGLGTVSIIMPMYQGVQSTSEQLSLAEQTNDGYRSQLTALAEAEGRKAEIEQSVAALRLEMPDNVQADTVLQVIANASAATEAFVESDSFAVAAPFAPQTGVGENTAPSSAPAPPADPAEGSDPSAEAGGAETSAGAPPADAAAGPGPEQQVEIQLTVSVRDTAMATSFLDQLRAGPRSLLVTSATLSKGGAHVVTNWDGTLKVTLLAFFYESGESK